MIHLFTDFGWRGPYVGEMTAVLAREAPGVTTINLMADAPSFSPLAAGILLARLLERIPVGDVVVAVVDPGVGTEREPLALSLDGRWLVGPDNGLFEQSLREADEVLSFKIAWRPAVLSSSFHGRDLFAPIAGRLSRGVTAGLEPHDPSRVDAEPLLRPQVIYADGYGNLITSLSGFELKNDALLRAGAGQARGLRYARTFGEVERGQAFWYVDSLGLVEIAVREGSAACSLGLKPGDPVEPLPPA